MNITIIKDTHEEIVLSTNDYTFTSSDTAVFKIAKKWGDAPLNIVAGAFDAENNVFSFAITPDITSGIAIERDKVEYVYEIECMLEGKKKVLSQGSLFICNTI